MSLAAFPCIVSPKLPVCSPEGINWGVEEMVGKRGPSSTLGSADNAGLLCPSNQGVWHFRKHPHYGHERVPPHCNFRSPTHVLVREILPWLPEGIQGALRRVVAGVARLCSVFECRPSMLSAGWAIMPVLIHI